MPPKVLFFSAMVRLRQDLINMVLMGVDNAKVLAFLVQVPGAAQALALQCKKLVAVPGEAVLLESFASICIARNRVDLVRLLVEERSRWLGHEPAKALGAICASRARVPTIPEPEIDVLASLAITHRSVAGLELAIDLGHGFKSPGRLHTAVLGALSPQCNTDDFALAAIELLLDKKVPTAHDSMDHVMDFLMLHEGQNVSPWRRRLMGKAEVSVTPEREVLQEILSCYVRAGAFSLNAEEVRTGRNDLPSYCSPLYAAVAEGCVVLADGLINLGASLDTLPANLDGALAGLAPEYAVTMGGLLSAAHMRRAITQAIVPGHKQAPGPGPVASGRRLGI